MRVRGMLATTALATSALFGLPAAAEEPDSCLLLVDDVNDTSYQGRAELAGFAVQPDVDITSADVSTDGELLYAVIRVQSLRTHTPGYPRSGETKYRLEFASSSRRYYVQVPSGYPASVSTYPYYWPAATAGRVGGRAYQVWSWTDYASSEIYVEAPLHVFGRGSMANGTLLGDLRATAGRTYSDNGQLAPGVSSRVSVGDTATSTQTYTAGAPSCITPAEPVFVQPEPDPAPPEPTPSPTVEPSPEPQPTQPPTSPTQEPTPQPTDPTPAPTEPTPQPTDPTPAPTEPTPEPTETSPAP